MSCHKNIKNFKCPFCRTPFENAPVDVEVPLLELDFSDMFPEENIPLSLAPQSLFREEMSQVQELLRRLYNITIQPL